MGRIQYGIKGMTCAACVAHVERAARRVLEDAADFTVSLLTSSIVIIPKNEWSAEEKRALEERLAASLAAAGYELVREVSGALEDNGEFRKKRFYLIVSAIFTAAIMYFAMGGMIGLPTFEFLQGTDGAIYASLLQLALCVPVVILNFRF